MTKPLLLPLPGNEELTRRLADGLLADVGRLTLRRFPDGETYVRLDTPVADREVIVVCTLDRPDDKLIPLALVLGAAAELGAKRRGLVAPYLAYMRQDRRFQEGEAVSSTYFAALLSRIVDWIVTVDPHLHRRGSLSEIYSIPTRVAHAAPLVADWIRAHVELPLIVGPDEESEQWVSSVADRARAPHVVLRKIRRGDRDVEVSVPNVERWPGHTPVLVDDIISTARTMIATVGQLRRTLLPAPVCLGVHGVLVGDAEDALRAAGARRIVTSNTILHPTNAIDVAPMLADGCRDILGTGAS